MNHLFSHKQTTLPFNLLPEMTLQQKPRFDLPGLTLPLNYKPAVRLRLPHVSLLLNMYTISPTAGAVTLCSLMLWTMAIQDMTILESLGTDTTTLAFGRT